jgi:hypothetical protein
MGSNPIAHTTHKEREMNVLKAVVGYTVVAPLIMFTSPILVLAMMPAILYNEVRYGTSTDCGASRRK